MKIAVVDPASYTLPYDYYWLKQNVIDEIDFYCSKSQYSNEYLEHFLKSTNIHLKIYNVSQKNKLLGTINYIKMLIDLLRNKSKYDKIHFQWSILFPVELPFFILLKGKLHFTFHNPTPHKKAPNPYWPFKLIYKLAREVYFVSNHSLNIFIKMYKITERQKIKLEQHPEMPISPKYEVKNLPTAPFEKTLLFWGNIKPYKGVDFFLEIAKSNELHDWKIEIWGKWDKELSSLKNELSLFSKVEIHDSFLKDDEIFNILKKNAIFVLPYKSGSQSGVIYTLKYYQKKFLCTPVGDQASIDSSYLFDRSNLRLFAEKVKSLIP